MSSKRSTRIKDQIDYKIYNDTGKKVIKSNKNNYSVMEGVQNEMKLVCKIKRFINDFSLELLFDISDIEEGLKEIRNLSEQYENVHVELKIELKESYADKYPGYDNQIKIMGDWTKEAKREIKRRKEEARECQEIKEEENKVGVIAKVKQKIRAEEGYCRESINREISNIQDLDSIFVEDIEKNIIVAKSLHQNYVEIFLKIDEIGVEFRQEFGELYEEQTKTIDLFIRNMQEKVQDLKLRKQKDHLEREKSLEDEIRKKEKSHKILFCNNIYDNICERFLNLENKCNCEIKNLSDIHIMERKDDLKNLNSDFNEVLDRITKLSEANPSQFSETKDLLSEIDVRKNKLKMSVSVYNTNIEYEISARDLSEEKLKNASLLKIELPKFKGYESSTDYYSFKTEFEKLISPRVHKKLLPDYLKNNYLSGQALLIVKEIDDIDEIWERLKSSFGNVNVLLSNKLREIEKGVPLWKIKIEEKLIQSITKIKNCMIELSSLATKHKIEESLFHSSNLAKIFHLIGKKRQLEITKKLLDSNKTDQETWMEIINFLNKELRLKERVLLFEMSNSVNFEDQDKKKTKIGQHHDSTKSFHIVSNTNKCFICGKTDHVPTVTSKGNSIINYFACEKFAKMNPKERFDVLKKDHFCFQCLSPGLKMKHEGFCFDKYKCPHESHNRFKSGLHILICDKHKNNKENLDLLDTYKSKYITKSDSSHADFSKKIAISFHAEPGNNTSYKVEGEDSEMAIYMLQTIRVGDKNLRLFYDTGCGDMVCRKEAIDWLEKENKAQNILSGPLTISGVGDKTSISEYGRYEVSLPLSNGNNAKLSGICIDKITGTFPPYPFVEVENDIREHFARSGGDVSKLPRLPKFVGGNTDVMIGIQYFKYFPSKVFSLPNGLSIYESQFSNPDGSRGIVGGPHRVFTEVHKSLGGNHMIMSAYLSNIVKICQNRFKLDLGISLLGFKEHHNDLEFDEAEFSQGKPADELIFNSSKGSKVKAVYKLNNLPLKGSDSTETTTKNQNDLQIALIARRPPKQLKTFEKVESAGTNISYRCVRCRGCKDCKSSGKIEYISIQEEIEQEIINKSVTIRLNDKSSEALLPFLCDPTKKLTSNEVIAKKMYFGQIRKLNLNPKDKQDIILAENKLHDLGFVDYLENLTHEQQNKICSSALKYFIPWRAVWNANSLSTPCRPVFDASHPTSTGLSLNDVLAKGRNNMNKLLQIFIRWTIRRCAFHTDVQKMYNSIKLNEDHWCYQLYFWENDLTPNVEPKIKVFKTLTYGLKPSGNQAERALRETANLQKAEYPRQNEIIRDDTYVDDCLSGEDSYDIAREVTDGLETVLNKGAFSLKGIIFSGFDPPEGLGNANNSVNVAGLKWFPKSDLLSLNITELNFGKKCRGKKSSKMCGVIPEKITRRDCAGRVAEIFDLLGRFTPLTAGFKLDLSELSKRKLDWDDFLPNDLVPLWKNNFEIISKLGEVKFQRAIVPEDALNLDMDTIEMSDASSKIACSAIYARFKRKNGLYSCQLVFARSKIVPSDMSIPRAELFAAVLNVTTGHVVSTSLSGFIKNRISLTDSQVVMYWINNVHSELNLWVRNRVIEINRLTNRENWYHIGSQNMIADLGTRKGVTISDISDKSVWVNGYEWTKYEKEKFPIKSYSQIKLNNEDLKSYNDELIKLNIQDNDWIDKQLSIMYCEYYPVITKGSMNEIGERYKFSHYILDPNKFRFKKVVRIVGLVILFVKNLLAKINKMSTNLELIDKLPNQFRIMCDKYLVTEGKHKFPFECKRGLTVELTEENLRISLNYYFKKATLEVKKFCSKNMYKTISNEKYGILYYTGRILPSQQINNKLNLSDVCTDLTMTTFCVPLVERYSPLAFAIVNEIHWYNDDVMHSGIESVNRYVLKVAYILEARSIVKQLKKECPRCRYLNKKAVDVAMGPITDDNLRIAPAFYVCQVDMFGPFLSYSYVNKRATTKIWFVVFCCCATGAVDVKVCEDYSANSFILAFIRFSCKVGYPRKLLPDAGSQLLKGCESMIIKFTDLSNVLHEYGVSFEVCPVGAHYMHGKVERKIRHIKESFSKHLQNSRLSVIQWETMGEQIANNINNLPIAIGNVSESLENIDLLTPNRLLLAKNNNRCPVGTLEITENFSKMIKANNDLFEVWFKSWLISYVPSLMIQPKWFDSDRDPKEGDVILFLKSDKEFDKQYQYGMISDVKYSRDGKIRQLEIEYQNHSEKVKRRTTRGTREIVIIHPVGELGLVRDLNILAEKSVN